ncbi:MAG: TRAP transporter permease [Chloroflexaceae bacterium]|nr:TRAP transporter permease [Chloroflexaceae bacterium]NJO06423.1 TRAP transporter permease [Chloroflexaceae bacterium]
MPPTGQPEDRKANEIRAHTADHFPDVQQNKPQDDAQQVPPREHGVDITEKPLIESAQLQSIVQKEDPNTRSLNRFWATLVALLALGMSSFYVYTAGTLPAPVQYQRGMYVGLTFILILLLYPAFPRRAGVGSWLQRTMGDRLENATGPMRLVRFFFGGNTGPTLYDYIMIGLTILTVGYYITQFRALQFRGGAYNDTDFVIGVIGLFVALEISRRVLGWSMTIIGGIFLIYLRFGELLYDIPILDAFAHRGREWDRVATILFFDQEGVFGVMANVLVSYVILFIFFGAFLRKSGASRFFIDLPLAIAGRSVGGPAKVAVLSSALFGSISGSAIANTVSTGTFTIPLMKRAGFRPHVAGAIEPAASIGGMFMPPVMGAGAFLMVELTSIPYSTIVLVSIFPAILYFTSVLTMVHFEAKKQGIQGVETTTTAWDIIRRDWYMSMPLLIIVVLMVAGFSPGYAAFWSIVSCVLLMYTLPDNAADFQQNGVSAFFRSTRRVIRTTYEALVEGSRDTLVIGATVGVIGIIVGTIYSTGVGLRFSDIIVSLSSGNLLLAIFLIGLASLVLGMGVPVTASYLIVAVLAVPALSDLGVSLIAAHMIVYWFSQDSNITPPVCVAAYAGAAIAGADPWKTGWTAFKFAKLLYVMPILFAYSPALLLVGETGQILTDLALHDVVMAYLSAFLGTVAFSAVTMGYLVRRTTWWEWIIAAFGTFLCFFPSLLTDIIGVAIVGAVWAWQNYDVRRQARLTAQQDPPTPQVVG